MSNTRQICVVVLCGLPASGKTIFCSKLMKLACFSFVHICYDSLLPWVTDSIGTVTWKTARSDAVGMVRHYLQCVAHQSMSSYETKILRKDACQCIQTEVSQSLLDCKPIIFLIDDNMQYRGMRYEYYQVAKAEYCGFCILFLDCPLSECEKRNKNRPKDKQVTYKSLFTIDSQMEIPGSTNIHWERRVLNIDTSENLLVPEDTISFLQNALDNPTQHTSATVDPLLSESCRQININNVRHQADLILRKICKDMIQSPDFFGGLTIKCKSKHISLAKKKILTEMKSDLFDLNEYVQKSGTINKETLEEKLQSLMSAYVHGCE